MTDNYCKLRAFVEKIQRENPGMECDFQCDPEGHFQRLIIVFPHARGFFFVPPVCICFYLILSEIPAV